jgi:hypothetical protein
MKAKVTISRDSRDIFRIEIEDGASGLPIVEIEMTPHDFAVALSGLSRSPAEMVFAPTEFTAKNIGKKCEVKPFFVERNWMNRAEQKAIVWAEFDKIFEQDPTWMLWDDGTGSQQSGDKHRAVMYRFVDEEDADA